jgi:hypothetical protein
MKKKAFIILIGIFILIIATITAVQAAAYITFLPIIYNKVDVYTTFTPPPFTPPPTCLPNPYPPPVCNPTPTYINPYPPPATSTPRVTPTPVYKYIYLPINRK